MLHFPQTDVLREAGTRSCITSLGARTAVGDTDAWGTPARRSVSPSVNLEQVSSFQRHSPCPALNENNLSGATEKLHYTSFKLAAKLSEENGVSNSNHR